MLLQARWSIGLFAILAFGKGASDLAVLRRLEYEQVNYFGVALGVNHVFHRCETEDRKPHVQRVLPLRAFPGIFGRGSPQLQKFDVPPYGEGGEGAKVAKSEQQAAVRGRYADWGHGGEASRMGRRAGRGAAP